MSNLKLGVRVRGIAALCALCLCVACLWAPVAHAADTVTRSVAGINFTLPADWEEVEVTEGVDVETGLANVQAYTKNDGVFFAATIPDADLGSGTLSDVEQLASLVGVYLAGTPFDSISCTAQLEQGVPTMTFYTNDLGLNGVQYAATLKLFVVDSAEFSGGVLMVSVLPASGQVSDTLDDLLTVLDEDTRVTVGGISYEIPAGCVVLDGYAFGVEFGLAVAEDGAVFLADVPELADDGTVTVEDLQYGADMLLESIASETLAEEAIQDLWSGAYLFMGFPTLAFELTAVDEATGEEFYVGSITDVSPVGMGFLMVVQPSDSQFAENLIGSAEATVEPLAASGSALPAIETAEQGSDPGFVVGA